MLFRSVMQREVMALLDDVRRLDERVGAVDRAFNQATKAFGEVNISIDKIKRRGEKIREADVSITDTAAPGRAVERALEKAPDPRAPSLFPRP